MKLLSVVVTLALLSSCAPYGKRVDVGSSIVKHASSKVLKLTPTNNPRSGGTGFELVAPSGNVITVTNSHICELSNDGFLIGYWDGEERGTRLAIKEVSETTDLCVVEAMPKAEGLDLAPVGAELSDHIWALGHPYLNPLTLSDGYGVNRENLEIIDSRDELHCSGPSRQMKEIGSFFGPERMCIRTVDAVNTTVPIYPGNSGSPALDDKGQVVGVFFASMQSTARGSYIPFDSLMEFIRYY